MIISGVGSNLAMQGVNDLNMQNNTTLPWSSRQDQVSFSQTARDLAAAHTSISNPAALLSDQQVQVKMSLLGDFMDILFGRQEQDNTTSEQEIASAVLEKPVSEESLQILQQNGWIA
ncbi:hypothetical protein [Candidatus Magnetaquicoccus inordinatus]|uniref:hypothetical protein n=1 Tax=Candidatus Magnetaquicoccus inordinatus TaxID=2496818 RepID=UPI00102B517E|nr:hypothetical protein [Candidatus Magnetaquicoccus inordinatus]